MDIETFSCMKYLFHFRNGIVENLTSETLIHEARYTQIKRKIKQYLKTE